MRRRAQHVDVGAGAEHALLAAGDHQATHLGMLEAQPLQRIGELDVDAQVVRIELELVARLEAAILVDIEDQRRNRALDVHAPVRIAIGMRVEGHHRVNPRASRRPRRRRHCSSSCRLCAIDLPEVSTIASALRYSSSRPARMRFRSSIASVLPAIGPLIALRDHACHVLFGLGLEPHDAAGRQQQVEGFRLRYDAAAGRDHHRLVAQQQRLQRAPLVPAVRRQAVEQEQLRQRGSRGALDLAVELDKRDAAPGGEPRAQRRLAGAAQARSARSGAFAAPHARAELAVQRVRGAANFRRRKSRQPVHQQRDFGRRFGAVARQLLDRHLDRLRDLLEQQDRDIAAARIPAMRDSVRTRRNRAPAMRRDIPRRARISRTRSPIAAR